MLGNLIIAWATNGAASECPKGRQKSRQEPHENPVQIRGELKNNLFALKRGKLT